MKEDRKLFSEIRGLNPNLKCVLFFEFMNNLNIKTKIHLIDIDSRIGRKKVDILLEEERRRMVHQNEGYYGSPIIIVK